MSRFKKTICSNERRRLCSCKSESGFSLIEVATALIILSVFSMGILEVIDRCMGSAADSIMRMQAFDLARENMETVLVSDSVKEMVEYGISDKNPEIEWQMTVESFYAPSSSGMWVQAVCSAEYVDSKGEEQLIELTHWLTKLTDEQAKKLMEQREKELIWPDELLIESLEEAALYANAYEETIEEWVKNGMPTSLKGYYIKPWLDFYYDHDGNPTLKEKMDFGEAVRSQMTPKDSSEPESKSDSKPDQELPPDFDPGEDLPGLDDLPPGLLE